MLRYDYAPYHKEQKKIWTEIYLCNRTLGFLEGGK